MRRHAKRVLSLRDRSSLASAHTKGTAVHFLLELRTAQILDLDVLPPDCFQYTFGFRPRLWSTRKVTCCVQNNISRYGDDNYDNDNRKTQTGPCHK